MLDINRCLPCSKLFCTILYYAALIGIGLYFLVQGYIANRTNTFISLDPTAGDCSEVPQTITGKHIVLINRKS